MKISPLARAAAALAAAALVLAAGTAAAPTSNTYTATVLVSDGSVPTAQPPDPDLVNAWGLTAGPTTPWWVADNGTGVSTLYTGGGTKLGLVVDTATEAPTGLVFNGGPSFVVSDGAGHSGPALFIFSSEDGAISGWNPGVPPPPPSHSAQVEVRTPKAIYKGLAIATTATGPLLYATDFHHGRVDVFDGNWMPVATPGGFVDRSIPHNYAPFGIQTIGSRIFVTYAKVDADAEDDVAGVSHGFIDAYDTAGRLLAHVATRGALNSPWGLALAPSNFGRFSGDLLVGNFGDGRIHAYQERRNNKWVPQGTLRPATGEPLSIDGLWALQFGTGSANSGPTNTLFFTAGPDDETHGLFGSITAG